MKASKLPSCDGDVKQKEEKKSFSKDHLDTMESPLWVRVASVYLLCAIMTNHACAVALDDRGASQKGQSMRPGERNIISSTYSAYNSGSGRLLEVAAEEKAAVADPKKKRGWFGKKK